LEELSGGTHSIRNRPIYFVEVQFQKDDGFYWRLFGEIFIYLKQYKPIHDWRAVVIYPGRSVDRDVPMQYRGLMTTGHLNGATPEGIAQDFPLLTLEEVYGAIAFYLANREAIDVYLKEGEAEFEQLQQVLRIKNPQLYDKLIDTAYLCSQSDRANS
jgi:hypothetical protein